MDVGSAEGLYIVCLYMKSIHLYKYGSPDPQRVIIYFWDQVFFVSKINFYTWRFKASVYKKREM